MCAVRFLHDITSEHQLALASFVDPIIILIIRLKHARMPKQRRIERVRCERIVVDAKSVHEAFRIPMLGFPDDLRLNARRAIANGSECNVRIRIGRKCANLSKRRATAEYDGADLAVGG